MENGKLSRLIEICKAYYIENRTQSEIAKSLGITRSQVSRDLKEARERGLVEIKINIPGQEAPALSEKLSNYFPHLKHVIVAPTLSRDVSSQRAMVGRYGANLLMSVIKPDQRIVVGSGRTLRELVNTLQKTEVTGISVLQAMGNIGHEAHGVDYNEICTLAAFAFNATPFYISAPAILGEAYEDAKEFIDAHPTIKTVLDLARNADIYVVGIGSLQSDLLYVKVGMIKQDELNDISKYAVGDICGHFFDINGNRFFAPFSGRIVGIDIEDLKKAPLSIGVAVGADKVFPIIGALRGQWINALVTDEDTANRIIRILRSSEYSITLSGGTQ